MTLPAVGCKRPAEICCCFAPRQQVFARRDGPRRSSGAAMPASWYPINCIPLWCLLCGLASSISASVSRGLHLVETRRQRAPQAQMSSAVTFRRWCFPAARGRLGLTPASAASSRTGGMRLPGGNSPATRASSNCSTSCTIPVQFMVFYACFVKSLITLQLVNRKNKKNSPPGWRRKYCMIQRQEM